MMEKSSSVPEFAENSFYGVNDLTVYVGNRLYSKKFGSTYPNSNNNLGLNGEINFLVAQ